MGIHRFDVLVIGGGGAGGLAAIRADEAGARTVLVNKTGFPSGNTSIAHAGFQAALGHADPNDSPDLHFRDTVRRGHFLSNQKVVRAFVEESIKIPRDLDAWGAEFWKQDDKYYPHPCNDGYTTYPRGICHGERTGQWISKALSYEVGRRAIPVHENVMVTRLLTENGRVTGAVGLNLRNRDTEVYLAKCTVLATGGLGRIFAATDNPPYITGEGYALAYEASAELLDMEMVHWQIVPRYPEAVRYLPLHPGELIANGARLYNSRCERLDGRRGKRCGEMQARTDAVVTHELVINIFQEVHSGNGTEHRGAFMDFSGMPESKLMEMRPELLSAAKFAKLNLGHQPIEAAPGAHTMLGGVAINEYGESSVEGLYAAGEVAGGLHGASRLGGNALAEAFAFGSIAGRNAAKKAQSLPPPGIDSEQVEAEKRRIEAITSRREGLGGPEAKQRMQSLMENMRGVRDENGLLQTIQGLETLCADIDRRLYAKEGSLTALRECLEAQNMVVVAMMMTKSALERRETRGFHVRFDYPKTDDVEWLTNVIISNENGSIKANTRPVVTTTMKPE